MEEECKVCCARCTINLVIIASQRSCFCYFIFFISFFLTSGFLLFLWIRVNRLWMNCQYKLAQKEKYDSVFIQSSIIYGTGGKFILLERCLCHSQAALVLGKMVYEAMECRFRKCHTLLPPSPSPLTPPSIFPWNQRKRKYWGESWTRSQMTWILIPFCNILAMVPQESPVSVPQIPLLWNGSKIICSVILQWLQRI